MSNNPKSETGDIMSDIPEDEIPERWVTCSECGVRWPPELLMRLGGMCSQKCSRRRRDRQRYRDRIAKERGGTWEDVRKPAGRKQG
jgi:hypothetical protein